MEYFLSHIWYIAGAGLVIGAIAVIAALVGAKNNEEASKKDSMERRYNMGCKGCAISGMCFGLNSNEKTPDPETIRKVIEAEKNNKDCRIVQMQQKEGEGGLRTGTD
jgi:hypothetical protein